MNKVLLTCPTRGRPELLKKMVESFYDTKSYRTDLAIYIDDDDPRLSDYDIKDPKTWVMPRKHVAQIHNWLINQYPDYDYYMPVNDDIEFVTPGWDKILVDTINLKGGGWGIAYGNDSTGNDRHSLPTFGMVSSNIIKTLGYVYPVELKAMFGDTFLLDLGRAVGRLFYCPEVVLKHTPPTMVEDDHRFGKRFYKSEQLAYCDYIDSGGLDRDVARIFDGIVNNKVKEAIV